MGNPYDEWSYHILKYSDELRQAWMQSGAKSVGFDTEADDLHIIKGRPFLFQIGWNREVYMFEPTQPFMQVVFEIFRSVKWIFAHNIKYDLNMICNLGYEREVQAITGWCDTMAVMRLSLEAKSPRDGGDKLGLKELGVKYIHPYANNSEQKIKAALKELNDSRVKVLTAALKQFDKAGAYTATGRQKKWGKADIEDFLKDPTTELEDLPPNIREVWEVWQEEYPEPNYSHIPMDIMYQYAGEDIATMMMLVEQAFPILKTREQMDTLQRERNLIVPALMMEREGLLADGTYLEESRIKVRDYIRRCRNELEKLSGWPITVNQHAKIKDLFDKKWDIVLDSSDKTAMSQLIANHSGEPQRFAQLINALRTAEKWYSTYIRRVQNMAAYDGRAYTQINLSGAISGRMSSDFQQFSRDVLKDIDTGEVLFNPRRSFKVGGTDEKGSYQMIYIDYDQIELVTQSHYCLMLKAEGTNLIRAYMPYKCHHYLTGEEYDYRTDAGRARWNECDADGKTVWRTENGELWVRTDLHTLTASSAFPDADTSTVEFKKKLRPLGKKTNFASNYGGTEAALAGDVVEGMVITWEIAQKLVEGYNAAFPEVKYYQTMIQKGHAAKGYVTNIMGRRYYLQNNRDAYKLANAIVQGSCADAFKEAIIELFEYLKDKKSKMVLPVHDEQSFKVYDDEAWIIPHLQEIMQRAFKWCLVPVTAGVEASRTYWSEKKDYEPEKEAAL